MKTTGYVRQIDPLGRLVLPVDLRKSLDVKAGENSVEIFYDADNDRVILQKYVSPAPACVFCGSQKEIVCFKDKHICKSCMKALVS